MPLFPQGAGSRVSVLFRLRVLGGVGPACLVKMFWVGLVRRNSAGTWRTGMLRKTVKGPKA